MKSDDSAYVGCRNRYIYGYDLRKPVSHSTKFTAEYEHQSCVSSLVMSNYDSNILISSDYTGHVRMNSHFKNIVLFYLFSLLSQIYVWDLRQNKTIAKYYDYKNKCSVKLSKCGNYLFSGK